MEQPYNSTFEDVFLDNDDIVYMRDRIKYYLLDQDYENAVFWSEKIYLLTNEDVDLYSYLQGLISSRRFRHVLNVIELKYAGQKLSSNVDDFLPNGPLWVRYFAAKCYSNLGQCSKAIQLLRHITPTMSADEQQLTKNNTANTDSYMAKSQLLVYNNQKSSSSNFVDENLLIASAARLKATILEYMSDNKAASYFVTSLTKDICHYGSARKLFENKMISPGETKSLINECENIIINSTNERENKFSRISLALYLISSGLHSPSNTTQETTTTTIESSLKDENNTWSESLQQHVKFVVHSFTNSLDIMRWKSDHYISTDFSTTALDLTQEIVNKTNLDDPMACVLHALTLFKCCRAIDLKVLSDVLAADSNISINKQIIYRIVCSIRDLSTGHASKSQDNLRIAVKLCAIAALRGTPWLISPATLWIILGHAAWLAGDKEHSLASFNAAADISPGSYVPWFFIGGLHAETEELSLALTYHLKAHSIAKKHYSGVPLYMANEIACIVAKKGNFLMAIQIILNSLGVTAVNETLLLNYIVNKKKPKLYTTLLHNLSYCLFKVNKMDEAYRFAQLANGIYQGTIQNQKLYGFLFDYAGRHKDAQFIYQTIVLETSKLNEFKHTSDLISARDPNSNNILPPPANMSMYAKEYDSFCTRMIERSLYLERSSCLEKNHANNFKETTTPAAASSGDGDVLSTSTVHPSPNTSLSFNDKTMD